MTSFLQYDEWADFQKSLGKKVFDVADTKIIKHDLPFGKNYLYVPYADTVPDLRDLARREKSIFVKVEPLHDELAQALVHQGYQKSLKHIQPQRTVLCDLTKSEEELFGAMHHKTRYDINLAQRHRIVVRESEDIEEFWKLMQKTTARDGFSSHPKDYYQKLLKLCTLYVAYKEQTPLAAAMILTHGDTAYYLHGASDHEHRAMMAPYALHWTIILKLKALSFKLYDLWGIDAQKWPGVTRFKLGWGGRTIEYPGAFDLVISKAWKIGYDLFQRLRM